MEHAFGGSHWDFSTDLDIDRKVNFSCDGRPFDIDNSNCLNSFCFMTVRNDVDEIFCLSWLTDHYNSLIWANIILQHFGWIVQVDFLKCSKFFEKVMRGQRCIIRRSTGNETEVISKRNSLNPFKFRLKFDGPLLADFIAIERLIWLWLLDKDIFFVLMRDILESSLLLHFFFQLRNFTYLQFKDLVIFCDEEKICFFFECNRFRGDENFAVIKAN